MLASVRPLIRCPADMGGSTPGRSIRRGPGTLVALGLVSALVAGDRCLLAQDIPIGSNGIQERLTVRPHKMVMATRTAEAGEHALEVDGVVYVPPQAVGTQRVPLVVFLHGGGVSAQDEIDMHSRSADKYGMIIVAVDHVSAPVVDTALKEALGRFAIDPDRIALIGSSTGGNATLLFGCNNQDVFSRLAPISPVPPENYCAGKGPGNSNSSEKSATRLLLSAGLGETDLVRASRRMLLQLRHEGYAVEVPVFHLRHHLRRSQDFEFALRWLQTSWATPGGAPLTLPPSATDSLPLLSPAALGQMATFWTRVMREPEVVWKTERLAATKPVTLVAGQDSVVISDMVDMTVYAARSPAITAALKAARLSAAHENAYRAALITARVVQLGDSAARAVPPTSVLGQNLALMEAHPADVAATFDGIYGVTEAAKAWGKKVAESLNRTGQMPEEDAP